MTYRQKSDPRRDTRTKVAELRGRGFTVIQIAKELRITPARVYQHLKALSEEER